MRFEGIDSEDSPEYDSRISRGLKRILGALFVHHSSQGDEVHAGGSLRDRRKIEQQVNEALHEGLAAEYQDAINRSQSLLVYMEDGNLPPRFKQELQLMDARDDELSEAISDWRDANRDDLDDLRRMTITCAYGGDKMPNCEKEAFCQHVQLAEKQLRGYLRSEFS